MTPWGKATEAQNLLSKVYITLKSGLPQPHFITSLDLKAGHTPKRNTNTDIKITHK